MEQRQGESTDEQVQSLPDRIAMSVVTDSPINKIAVTNFMNPGAVTSASATQSAPIDQGTPVADPGTVNPGGPMIPVDPAPEPIVTPDTAT